MFCANVDDSRSVGFALANGGGFPVSPGSEFCWKDIYSMPSTPKW